MLDASLAMLWMLLTWIIVGGAFIGIGLAARFALGGRERELDAGESLLAFWIGFASVILFLQTWNFFAPINLAALTAVLIAGAIGLLLNRSALVRCVTTLIAQRKGALIVVGLTAVWLANRSLGPANADDSGLYHFTAILWARSFPVITGVANLSAPQAMNNASFLYAALLDHGPWQGRVEHIASGLLLLAMFVQSLRGVARLITQRGWMTENILNAALLPAAFMLAIAKDVSSPKTDLPAGALTVAIGWWFLRFLLHPDANERRTDRFLALAMLCAAAVCVKLSTVVLVGGMGLIALATFIRSSRKQGSAWIMPATGAMTIVALMLGTWMGRSVIMSGYPAFPSRILPVDVPWRVQTPAMVFLEDAIRKQNKAGTSIWIHQNLKDKPLLKHYAPLIKPPFETRDDVRGVNWVRSWFFALPLVAPIEIVMPFMIAVIGLISIRRCRTPPNVDNDTPRKSRSIALVLLAAPAIASLVFWFIAGPDPRYGWPSAWLLGAFVLARAFAGDRAALTPRARRFLVALIVVAIVPVFAYRASVQIALGRDRPLHEVLVYGPGPDRGFHPRPSTPMTTTTTRHGLVIHVPTGDFPYHCWNGPLPCTGWPPLDSDLRLRVEGDLGSGFVIDHGPSRSP